MRRMMSGVLLAGVWISVAASIVGFVRPWVTLEASATRLPGQVGHALSGTGLEGVAQRLTDKIGRVTIQFKRGAETLTGDLLPDLSTIPTTVSGAQIPHLVNRRDAKVVMAFAEMWTGQRELGAKSYAVYLVPGLALVFGLILTLARPLRLVCAGLGGVCLVIAGAGFWKLLTTKTDTLLVAITIGPGLWLSLWAYVGLGLSAIGVAMLGSSRYNALHCRDSSGSRAAD